MRVSNIKVIFQAKQEDNDILWENHVNEIINGIESAMKTSFKVRMNNFMPIKEMNNVIKELCDTLDYRLSTLSKYYRANKCIAAGYTDMLSSATYYIEMRINE